MSKAMTTRTARRSGQIMIVFAFSLVVLVAICVLTIDVGRMVLAKAQLRNAVDAAALAGASQLTSGFISDAEKAQVRSEARSVAALNFVDGDSLTLANADIQFGHYDGDTGVFVPEGQTSIVDSVRVVGRRTNDAPDGPIDMFFGGLFGLDEIEIHDVTTLATKPRRYVMFSLDRSGSMCFDTDGVQTAPYSQNGSNPHMDTSPSGWYWFPDLALKRTGYGWRGRTAWFWAQDNNTGRPRIDFLPEHIRNRVEANRYFNFRPRDYPDSVTSGWIKVPAGVTIRGRWGSPWHNWFADPYFHVIPANWAHASGYGYVNLVGYAITNSPVQPLQNSMDAATAFVDLLRVGDDEVGLVTYAALASTDQILTRDLNNVKIKLQSFVPHGATAEPDAMEAALDELIDSGRADGYGQRIMILLTDGNANRLHGNNYDNDETRTYSFMGESVTTQIHPTVGAAMEQQTQRASNGGVRIYCVTFGSDVDTEVHEQIARNTQGAYYHAANHEDLTSVFIDIFRRLPPLITK